MTDEKKEKDKPEMELGVQPLEAVLHKLKLTNSALVEASTEQLTFKIVTKGRKGRRLTINARMKILNALNSAQSDQKFTLKDIFNYS